MEIIRGFNNYDIEYDDLEKLLLPILKISNFLINFSKLTSIRGFHFMFTPAELDILINKFHKIIQNNQNKETLIKENNNLYFQIVKLLQKLIFLNRYSPNPKISIEYINLFGNIVEWCSKKMKSILLYKLSQNKVFKNSQENRKLIGINHFNLFLEWIIFQLLNCEKLIDVIICSRSKFITSLLFFYSIVNIFKEPIVIFQQLNHIFLIIMIYIQKTKKYSN